MAARHDQGLWPGGEPRPNRPWRFGDAGSAGRQGAGLAVRIRPAQEAGGIADPAALEARLRPLIASALGAGGDLVTFVKESFYLEIARNPQGALEILDPEGAVRNRYATGDGDAVLTALVRDLSNDFQQLTLRSDWTVKGGWLTPNESLMVRLVPRTAEAALLQKQSVAMQRASARANRLDAVFELRKSHSSLWVF